MTKRARTIRLFTIAALILSSALGLAAQAPAPTPAPAASPVPARPAGVGTPAAPANVIPADYVIGVDDILAVGVLREPEMSVDGVVVRPDGKITLPVMNEIVAAGLTTEQLRTAVTALAVKFKEDPSVTVVVKQINSRKVFITGEVAKPGPYALSGRMTVIQLIALAGGLNEYAKADSIAVIRTEGDQQKYIRVNYEQVVKGKNLKQNVDLHVGDVVMVQ